MPDAIQLGREVIECCVAAPPDGLGFAAAGISDAEPTRWGHELVAWLEAGRHGSMAYLKDQLAARLDPRLVLPGTRSAVMVADLYAARGEEVATDGGSPARGRIARYAWGSDYHKVIRKRLHRLADMLRARYPAAQFRAFVDTAPVLEREYAARAGLGWVGKHTLLIHPRLGSYTLLGGILTTLELRAPPEQGAVEDHCGTCTRCIDACPTEAISPYSVDASRCISYLTIERRGPVDPGFHEKMGDWIYGCDVCQQVCPHNSARPAGSDVGSPHTAYSSPPSPPLRNPNSPQPPHHPQRPEHPRRPGPGGFALLDVLGWRDEDRASAFQGSAMKRATLEMMRRNALIAAGNALRGRDEPALRQRLEEVEADEDEPAILRITAQQVLNRLREDSPLSLALSGERGLTMMPSARRSSASATPDSVLEDE